ncbi:SDR family oxidoreductase [Caulobacter vibrioides]|uniref:SDR family oxidoreductase n=1 Tax=Caulobacter vibrioides TaxID=155892 RepID=UPI000BB4CD06|nr:SDR family oxidoreductase [Caulobacter vibrioides]ATC23419.1 short chain dehydrogenase [Caulobacter vibrioides]AZH11628.1 SDR family oxidoreductase [Caulobacter vibrioides]PLR11309.1 short chain dehydrogenase [Caulobacter vibrioides]
MTSRGAALVTGAGRRIGQVLALEAARAGYDVAIHYRASADEAEATARAVQDLGRRALLVRADLSDEEETRSLVAQAASLGPLTLLINNASAFEDDRVGGLSRASWDRHLETNLRAPIVLAEAMAGALPDERQGLVVNLIDQRVWRPNPQFFSYTLSKAGLWWATQTLAQALAPRIRVNAIGPGPTLPSVHQAPGEFEAEAAGVLLQRRASPEEVAAALRYLIDASSVTGQMIAVDGGQHLGWKTPDIVAP